MSLRRRVLATVGVLLLLACSVGVGFTIVFLARAERMLAVIDDGGPGGRHPVMHFTLPSGKRVPFVAGGVFKPLRAGGTVDVIFSPADPAGSATLDTFGALWAPHMLVAAVGLGMVSLGRARAGTWQSS